jgi:hypothetical protein
VVLMVMPPGKDAEADTRIPPPPAPERMDTNPLPPQGSMITPPSTPAPGAPDPWSQPKPPDPQAQIDPDDPTADPFANPNPGRRSADPLANLGFNSRGSAVMVGVLQHACARLAACGDPQVGLICSSMTQLFGNTPAPTCAAAQRCFERIDQVQCDAKMSSQADMLGLMTAVPDCAEAMTSC